MCVNPQYFLKYEAMRDLHIFSEINSFHCEIKWHHFLIFFHALWLKLLLSLFLNLLSLLLDMFMQSCSYFLSIQIIFLIFQQQQWTWLTIVSKLALSTNLWNTTLGERCSSHKIIYCNSNSNALKTQFDCFTFQ